MATSGQVVAHNKGWRYGVPDVRPRRFGVRALARAIALVAAGSLLIGVPVAVAPMASAAAPTGVDADPAPLAAPTGLAVTAGNSSATVTFIAPVADDTDPIINYEYSLDAALTWTPFVPAITATSATITGLINGQSYSIQLRAVTAIGPGLASDAVTVTPEAPRPPKPVVFKIGDKKVTKYVKVKPGLALKISNVPTGGRVEVIGEKDPSIVIAVRPTNKARMWTTDPLRPAVSLWARVYDASGALVDRLRFATERAENTLSAGIFPSNGQDEYGIGVPLVVTFDRVITNKAEVEQALVVTSDKEIGEAGWFWVEPNKAVFRPRGYWPGNATITLKADLTGVEGASGWWGSKIERTFKTGAAISLNVNLRKHVMEYVRNGEVEKTFPISGGRSGWETPSGMMLITTHESPRRLFNPGDPNDPDSEQWDVKVDYAMRTTQDGVFIHSAPWNYNLGYANTSHGCINMTVSEAGWLFNNTDFATPVDVKGSSPRVSTSEYLSGHWNYTWQEWKRGSALWKDQ